MTLTSKTRRTLIVTGFGKGIGFEIAKVYVENNDFVAMKDINEEVRSNSTSINR